MYFILMLPQLKCGGSDDLMAALFICYRSLFVIRLTVSGCFYGAF